MQFVVFLDDLFIVYADWLRELAERFPREVGLPFFCNVRANLVTPEKIDLLQAGRLRQRGHGPGDRQSRAAQPGPQAQPVGRADRRGQPPHPRGGHRAADDQHAGPAGRHRWTTISRRWP